jgi:hypothetical protein
MIRYKIYLYVFTLDFGLRYKWVTNNEIIYVCINGHIFQIEMEILLPNYILASLKIDRPIPVARMYIPLYWKRPPFFHSLLMFQIVCREYSIK